MRNELLILAVVMVAGLDIWPWKGREGTAAWGLIARRGEDQIITPLLVSLRVLTREMFQLEMVRVKSRCYAEVLYSG